MSSGRRLMWFLVVTSAAVAFTVGYVVYTDREEAPARAASAAAPARPFILFQHVARDTNYTGVAVAALKNGRARSRQFTGLKCERVHFNGTRGLCLVPAQTVGWRYDARIFDRDFHVQRKVRLDGIITRTRISPDGRYGAATGFVTGHSYASDQFSTQTSIIDLEAGTVVANLESFDAFDGDHRIDAEDVNYWGVTFARDSNRFYATLRTGGKRYLVEGDIGRRRIEILRENVECPSLSPDGERVAFKKRVDRGWRFHVLDLSTMRETPLAELTSVDDQIEWLDDTRVLYGKGGSMWSVPADGTGSPALFATDALSPAAIR